MIEDVPCGCEGAVGEPVVAHELLGVLDRVQLGGLGRQHQDGDVGGQFRRSSHTILESPRKIHRVVTWPM